MSAATDCIFQNSELVEDDERFLLVVSEVSLVASFRTVHMDIQSRTFTHLQGQMKKKNQQKVSSCQFDPPFTNTRGTAGCRCYMELPSQFKTPKNGEVGNDST